jgi:hypothetical protein
VAKEALFSNPASAALLTSSSATYIYTKPSIPDMNAGGRSWSLAMYDGENTFLKGAFGYHRTARARLENRQQVFEDRSEFRFAAGRAISGNILGGLAARYVTRREGPTETKFFQGDLGAIFPVYSNMRGGITLENLLEQAGEDPLTLGGGLSFPVGSGITLVGDGYRLMKGAKKGERGWGLAAELKLAGDFLLRGGLFQEARRRMRGWSAGLSWNGPRASFDYAYRLAGNSPKEKDHILGLNILF